MTSRTLGLAMVAAIVIGACGTDDESGTATNTAPPTITTTAVSTNDLAEGSGCTPGADHLPDGEWFGEVVEADAGELEFDLACWFVGEGAIAAAAEDGQPPPEAFYVRNVSSRTRRLPIAEDTPVVWYGMGAGDPGNPVMNSYAEWRVLEVERICCLGLWLTVDGGVVTQSRSNGLPEVVVERQGFKKSTRLRIPSSGFVELLRLSSVPLPGLVRDKEGHKVLRVQSALRPGGSGEHREGRCHAV